jgi:hypothetical protein
VPDLVAQVPEQGAVTTPSACPVITGPVGSRSNTTPQSRQPEFSKNTSCRQFGQEKVRTDDLYPLSSRIMSTATVSSLFLAPEKITPRSGGTSA